MVKATLGADLQILLKILGEQNLTAAGALGRNAFRHLRRTLGGGRVWKFVSAEPAFGGHGVNPRLLENSGNYTQSDAESGALFQQLASSAVLQDLRSSLFKHFCLILRSPAVLLRAE